MCEKLQLMTSVLVAGGALSVLLVGALSDGNAWAGGGEKTETAVATFAGGCFWCMEPAFDKLDGVISTTVGYTGGKKEDPTYEEVSAGTTGHAEAIRVEFDPQKITYEDVIAVFWRNIDPTTPNRQFCDVGTQYRTAVFYHNDEQRRIAEKTKKEVEQRLQHVSATEIVPASTFYPAEDYHQDFYKKNPDHYRRYRQGCGRDDRLEELWGRD
jgi:peptide-methionine (S)-S-oxide reductase